MFAFVSLKIQEINIKLGWPELECAFQLTLIIEAVDAIDGGALVVSPEQEEVFWVFDLIGEQQADGFQRLLPSVHIIPKEQVVGFRREAAIFE